MTVLTMSVRVVGAVGMVGFEVVAPGRVVRRRSGFEVDGMDY